MPLLLTASTLALSGCPQWNEAVVIAREMRLDGGLPPMPVPPEPVDAALPEDAGQIAPPVGDLIITDLSAPPDSVLPGGRIALELVVSAGSGASTPNTVVELRLQPQSSGPSRVLDTLDVPPMLAGAQTSLSVSAVVAAETPGQRYCLEATIDPQHQVRESNERNNHFQGECFWVSGLQVGESTLDFGTVGLGCSATATITLHNPSAHEIQVLSSGLTTPGGPFESHANQPAAPYLVAAGAEVELPIIYRPQSLGVDRQTYTIEHAAALGQLSVALVGAAMQAPVRIENHRAWTQPRVDILVVVDNSATMQQEQVQITQASSGLINVLYDSQVDYHLGVITTDLSIEGTQGKLQGGTLTPQTPRLGHEFAQALNVGIEGSEVEQGLDAARLALRPDTNPGFRRPEAGLLLIFISDEDDSSPQQDYLQAYLQSVGQRGLLGLRIAAVVPAQDPSEQCPTSIASGLRYHALAEATGGPVINICGFAWSANLSALLTPTLGLQTAFELQARPLPQTLQVIVDGVPQPREGPGGPTWSLQGNTVYFESAHAPGPGARIRFSYRTEC